MHVVGKPEGKKPLGRPKRMRESNLKMDVRKIESGGMKWILLALERNQWRALLNMVRNFRFP
jgi:hypothetical protein